MTHKHFGWDYEETAQSYYHIISTTPQAEVLVIAVCLDAPRTPENDASIELIVKELDAMVERQS